MTKTKRHAAIEARKRIRKALVPQKRKRVACNKPRIAKRQKIKQLDQQTKPEIEKCSPKYLRQLTVREAWNNIYLTPEAKMAFTTIFEQFASNTDGTMSFDDMQQYALRCGWDKDLDLESTDRIQDMFYGRAEKLVQKNRGRNWNAASSEHIHQHGVQNQDRLSFHGFLSCYLHMCQSIMMKNRPQSLGWCLERVWKDLGVFSYQYDMTPVVESGETVNGVVQLKLNMDDFRRDQFHYYETTEFELSYRCVPVTACVTDPLVESVWQTRRISISSINQEQQPAELYLKVAVRLYAFKLQFTLRAWNVSRDCWMSCSKVYAVEIPSFLRDARFKVGQSIKFRKVGQWGVTSGTIAAKIANNRFQVKHPTRTHLVNGIDGPFWMYKDSTTELDVSRLYHTSKKAHFVVDLVDKTVMYRHLLVRNDDELANDTFNVIREAMDAYSRSETIIREGLDAYSRSYYKGQKAVMHQRSMSTFVAKEVFDMLSVPQNKFSVDCLLNGDAHCGLKMLNLRESDIRTKHELLRKGIGNVYYHPLMHHQLHYACDWCCCDIDEFDFVFQCSGAQYVDRHDYCMSCVGTDITMTQELNVLLNEVLRTQLVPDCIRCIVDHVIGRLVVSKAHTNF